MKPSKNSSSSNSSRSSNSSTGSCSGDPVHYPTSNDCLLGRGGESNNHSGNVIFRGIIEAAKPTYRNAPRSHKQQIVKNIVARWRGLDPPGRFLAKDTTKAKVDAQGKPIPTYYDVGDEAAKKRTAKALSEKIKASFIGATNQATAVLLDANTNPNPALSNPQPPAHCKRPTGQFNTKRILSRLFAQNPIEAAACPGASKRLTLNKKHDDGKNQILNLKPPRVAFFPASPGIGFPGNDNPIASQPNYCKKSSSIYNQFNKSMPKAPPSSTMIPAESSQFQPTFQFSREDNYGDKQEQLISSSRCASSPKGADIANILSVDLIIDALPFQPSSNYTQREKQTNSTLLDAEILGVDSSVPVLQDLPAAAELIEDIVFP